MKTAMRLVLAVCLWVGCGEDAGSDDTEVVDAGPDAARGSDGSTDGGSPTGELGDAGEDTQPGEDAKPDAAATPAQSEAQVLGLATTIYNLEIAAGELASNRATDPDVIAYAQAMVSAFTADQGRALALGITPEVSADANAFIDMATLLVQSVADASDEAFDAKYLESQVSLHTAELAQFDGVLLPNATPKLAAELSKVRGEIADHLQKARALASK